MRRYPHPIERVYRAWSVPRHLEGRLRPDRECRLRVAAFDFREGGEFLFEYEWGDNASPVRGKFLTIVPAQTLVYSWSPQAPDPYAGRETMVTVSFTSTPGGTEVVVRHSVFPDDIMRERHRVGWESALDLLAEQLRAGSGSRPTNFP